MSASKAYKPAHGGYPSAEPQRKGWKVVYCDEFGRPDDAGGPAWVEADPFGGNGNGSSEDRGLFNDYNQAVSYLQFRRGDTAPGYFYTIVEVRQ